MRTFSGDTDAVHAHDVEADLRAYFSATSARIGEELWLRLDARWVADGTPVAITLFREDDEGGRETVKELDGRISDQAWELAWKVELPPSRLDAWPGPLHLRFEARLDGHPLPAESQALLVHRTRFSS